MRFQVVHFIEWGNDWMIEWFNESVLPFPGVIRVRASDILLITARIMSNKTIYLCLFIHERAHEQPRGSQTNLRKTFLHLYVDQSSHTKKERWPAKVSERSTCLIVNSTSLLSAIPPIDITPNPFNLCRIANELFGTSNGSYEIVILSGWLSFFSKKRIQKINLASAHGHENFHKLIHIHIYKKNKNEVGGRSNRWNASKSPQT